MTRAAQTNDAEAYAKNVTIRAVTAGKNETCDVQKGMNNP